MTQIQLAKQIAVVAHANQTYGGELYTYHLQAVHDVLYMDLEQRWNDELLAAAWLHDVLEDTSYGVKDLINGGVSPYTVALVDAVTDQPGKNRAARHVLTYPRIARMDEAVLLKLADRIANCRNSSFMRKDLMQMYRDEFPEFKACLQDQRRGGPWKKAWNMLHEIIGVEAEAEVVRT